MVSTSLDILAMVSGCLELKGTNQDQTQSILASVEGASSRLQYAEKKFLETKKAEKKIIGTYVP